MLIFLHFDQFQKLKVTIFFFNEKHKTVENNFRHEKVEETCFPLINTVVNHVYKRTKSPLSILRHFL